MTASRTYYAIAVDDPDGPPRLISLREDTEEGARLRLPAFAAWGQQICVARVTVERAEAPAPATTADVVADLAAKLTELTLAHRRVIDGRFSGSVVLPSPELTHVVWSHEYDRWWRSGGSGVRRRRARGGGVLARSTAVR